MESKNLKWEACLRLLACCVLVIAACLIRTNAETELVFGVYEKKAAYKSIHVFIIQLYVNLVSAGYNLVQLTRCLYYGELSGKRAIFSSYVGLPWLCFFLDQITVYLVFATNCASSSGSFIAVTGNNTMGWMKLCNTYTRFCTQVGAFLLCGYVASLLLAVVSSISALNLFRLYSPKQFMYLKSSFR